MRKKLIRISIIVCFIWSLTSCSFSGRITYKQTKKWQETTVLSQYLEKDNTESKSKFTPVVVQYVPEYAINH